MINIETIKLALINVNRAIFPESDAEKLFGKEFDVTLQNNSVKGKPVFFICWYGEKIYNETIKALCTDSADLTATLSTIIKSYVEDIKHNSLCRNDIYNYFSRFMIADGLNISETIEELALNIKEIIKENCIYRDKDLSKDHIAYANAVLEKIHKYLADDPDKTIPTDVKKSMDQRIEMFQLNMVSENKENPYKSLAIISLIALIPNDTKNKKQRVMISQLSDEFEKYYIENFPKTEINNNTAISSDLIIDKFFIKSAWNSWYQETKKEGSYFSKLFSEDGVIPEILPFVHTSPNNDHRQDQISERLIDIINDSSENFYIQGDGGIGKTTSLYSIMAQAYDEDKKLSAKQIPMFVELSRASQEDIPNKKRYIRNTLIRQLEKELKKQKNVHYICREELERITESLFTQETHQPEYVLLLDGLNEVSRGSINGKANSRYSIVEMVRWEICFILEKYKNVRVILTSRSKESLGIDITTLYLSGVDEKIIKSFLKGRIKDSSRLHETLTKMQLMEILKNPLFLTMYARITGKDALLSCGEILHTFFTQKKEGLYSERGRYATIENDFSDDETNDRLDAEITMEMLSFMLDFFLPTIAWHMINSSNDQEISFKEISHCVEQILADNSPTSWFGEHGVNVFKEYKDKEKPSKNVKTIAEEISKLGDSQYIADIVCNCFEKQLGVLVMQGKINEEDDEDVETVYKFLHQHIRDYFAALYHINKLKLAVHMNKKHEGDLARSCLSEWRDAPLPGQVLTFIGEALGEAHNAPTYNEEISGWNNNILDINVKDDRTLIMRGLKIYEKRYSGEDNYAVWNLFQILKLVRKDLSGEDFSNLDLTKCRANGYRLGNRETTAKFCNAKINDLFFTASGHFDRINHSDFSRDGLYVVTASDDKTAIIWNTKTMEEVAKLKGHTGKVLSAQFSKDNNEKNGIYHIVTSSTDGTAIVWEWNSKTQASEYLYNLSVSTKPVNMAGFSPDYCFIVTASDDKTAIIWNTNTRGNAAELKGHTKKVLSAQFSKNNDEKNGIYHIVTSSEDGTAIVWEWNSETQNNTLIDTIHVSKEAVKSAQFGKNYKTIITASDDENIKIWKYDGEKYNITTVLEGHKAAVNSACYSPDCKYILSSSSDNSLKLWDAYTNKPIPIGEYNDSHHHFWSATFSSDGKYIVANTYRATRILDAKTLSVVPGGELKSNFLDLFSATYSPNGDYIVLGCREGTAKVWNTKNYKEEPEGLLKGHKHSVYSARFSPRGTYIITSSGDRTAKIWDAHSYREIATLDGHVDYVHDAQFSNNEELVVTVSKDSTAKVWKRDKKSDKYEFDKPLTPNTGSINMVAFSPDEKYFITSSADGYALVWNTKSPYRQVKVKNPIKSNAIMESAVFSPNKNGIKKILTADHDGTVKLWDAESPFEPVPNGEFKGESDERFSASFSPDEKKIVVASWKGNAQVWKWNENKETYEKAGCLEGHSGRVSTAVFSPATADYNEGKFILTSSWDNTAIIWDAQTYDPIHTIHSLPGLEVWGVDLTQIYDKNDLDKETWGYLNEYGAIVDPSCLNDKDSFNMTTN